MQLPDEALGSLNPPISLMGVEREPGPPFYVGCGLPLRPKGKATAPKPSCGPIGILPYIYRVWMAVRKQHLHDWVRDGYTSGACQSAPAQALQAARTARGG